MSTNRDCKRNRRLPKTRSNDFFMVNNHRVTKLCNEKTNRYEYHTQHNLKPIKYAEKVVTIFHQNICGLPNNKEELLHSLTEHPVHIICLTKHHLHDEELEGMTFNKYTLGAKFCRKVHKGGGMCILIEENLHFTNINMDKYSKEMEIEICAIRIHTPSCKIVVVTVYRSPTGDVTYLIH